MTNPGPNPHMTPDGYVYYRCRANGDDATIYEHQLVALLDEPPADVFGDEFDVHHVVPVPWLNYSDNLELEERWNHRRAHIGQEGRA